mgnify:CR=1 FL=1
MKAYPAGDHTILPDMQLSIVFTDSGQDVGYMAPISNNVALGNPNEYSEGYVVVVGRD